MKSKVIDRLRTLTLLTVGLLFIVPVLVTLTNSFMSETEIGVNYASSPTTFDVLDGIYQRFMRMRLIPSSVTFGQYRAVLVDQPAFLILLTNSIKLTIPVVFGNLVVSLLAAYGFTLWTFRFKEAVLSVYIVVMLMPLQAVLVPNYIIADMLGIRQSYLAIILPGIFSPFGVFLLRQSMKSIPLSYIEAARMDGAGNLRIFAQIIAPQMKSSIAALIMLTFIEYWNLVEQAIVFISDYTREPLSVYLSRIAEGRISLVFAASCVYMVLPLWFLLIGQKNLEQGIELSGVK